MHIAYGDPATIYPPDKAPEIHAKIDFFADVFNLEPARTCARGPRETYAKFLRKTHAQDAALDEHRNVKPPPRRLAARSRRRRKRRKSTRSST